MRVQSNYSHTISGLFWFDLPLGLFLTFVFHNIVRTELCDNLPIILKSRLLNFNHFNWNKHFKMNWFVVLISILIGAASHLFWDSFTHESGYFAKTIPTLANVIEIFGGQFPISKIVQHSSSLIGGIIIAFSLYKLPTQKNIVKQFNLKYWSILASLTLAIIALRLASGLDYKLYGHLIVTCISAALIALTITPLVLKPRIKSANS